MDGGDGQNQQIWSPDDGHAQMGAPAFTPYGNEQGQHMWNQAAAAQGFHFNAGAVTFVPGMNFGSPAPATPPQYGYGGGDMGAAQQVQAPGYYLYQGRPVPSQEGMYGAAGYGGVAPQHPQAPPAPAAGGFYAQGPLPGSGEPPLGRGGGGRGTRGDDGSDWRDGGQRWAGGGQQVRRGGQRGGARQTGTDPVNWREEPRPQQSAGGRGAGRGAPGGGRGGRGGRGGMDEGSASGRGSGPQQAARKPLPVEPSPVVVEADTPAATPPVCEKAVDDSELPDDWEEALQSEAASTISSAAPVAENNVNTPPAVTTPLNEATATADSSKKAGSVAMRPDAVAEATESRASDADEKVEEPIVKKHLINSKLPPADSRPHLNIVFIGHVDAGKSTTCGNILYLTEQVDQRTIEKYERDAKEKNRDTWFFAFIMDINEEERAKGKTVEVGRALFDTKNKRYTILDAPGHKSFVPNMISGAAQADVGVLIISARKGEFETGFERGGQTREHAMLSKTLGVNQIIVAVNKMDDPTCDWSEARFRDIEKKLTPFLRSSGYNPAKDIFFIPISGLTGQNIKYPVGDPSSPCYVEKGKWYTPDNPPLLTLLDSLQPPLRSPTDSLRIPLLEGYKDQGVIAPGKVEAGTIYANDNALIMPGRIKVKIAGILVNEQEVAQAPPGENVSLRVIGVEDDAIQKGAVLSGVDDPCPVVTKFKCQVMIVELLEHRPILTAGYSCVLHAHTMCEDAQFVSLLEVVDKVTKRKKTNPKFVKGNSIVICTLQLSNGVCLEPYDIRPQLGRFTLRDEGKTIGVGKVLEILE